MTAKASKNTGPQQEQETSRGSEITNTLEWLVTAFILAFLVRAFIMEAYRIPTGSMADTLKGDHFRLCCQQCGYKYDCGSDIEKYRQGREAAATGTVKLPISRCPSCGHYDTGGRPISISNGDRILVLKCIYQFFEPKQWDVIVFKNPLNPTENYIKRLIGRPGETVEIIDGDIYIDGEISRKPAKVQEELWMPVYDNDYQPARPGENSFNSHAWQQPFRNIAESKWVVDKSNPTVFQLAGPAGEISTLNYDTSIGNDFRTTYAYDSVGDYKNMPYCSDLMVRFYAQSAGKQGGVGATVSKYQTIYKAWVDLGGEMVIGKVSATGEETILEKKTIDASAMNKPTLVEFANVDHQLIFQFGNDKLVYDLDRSAEDAGEMKRDIQPQVNIFGSGTLALSHIAIFRDIHYTAKRGASGLEGGRAIAGTPFTLSEGEFFVLGDNSPNSEDGRWWNKAGIGNNGQSYREGIVPSDYLVGKALFVYWPGGFEFPWPANFKNSLLKNSRHSSAARLMYWLVSWKWIPCIGQMRFICGG
ncbi:MAG: signal peptidase I [Phycisphaerae bacterium]|nr:signal peptidase I [Phycisphaerae bacterium]MDD5382020.1 signal peptidase I [Phycisphaerae bacterium]